MFDAVAVYGTVTASEITAACGGVGERNKNR